MCFVGIISGDWGILREEEVVYDMETHIEISVELYLLDMGKPCLSARYH